MEELKKNLNQYLSTDNLPKKKYKNFPILNFSLKITERYFLSPQKVYKTVKLSQTLNQLKNTSNTAWYEN